MLGVGAKTLIAGVLYSALWVGCGAHERTTTAVPSATPSVYEQFVAALTATAALDPTPTLRPIPSPTPTLTPVPASTPPPTLTPAPTQRPSPLTGHTALVREDGRVLVLSWRDGARIFNLPTMEWQSVPGIRPLPSNHTATALTDGWVLLVGGSGSRHDQPGPAYLYDGRNGVREIAGPAQPRFFHGAIRLGDGRVLVAGSGPPSRSVEIFDPATEAWVAAADMKVARALPRMVRLPDGGVLVAGGLGFLGHNTPISEVEIYDPILDRWSLVYHAPETVQGVPITLGDGRVLFVGAPTWLFDQGTGDWAELPGPPGREIGFSVTSLSDGRVLVLGGGTRTDTNSPPRLTASAVLFDPATNAWKAAQDFSAPRWLYEAVELPDGRVLVIGGSGEVGGDSDVSEIEIYSVPSSRGNAAECPVTIANGYTPPGETPHAWGHGDAGLTTALWPEGKVVFEPGGPGFVDRDGSLSMKWPWTRGDGVVGRLAIEGRRLDAPALPLRAQIPEGYGDTGFQSTSLIFPSEGCWEVTGRAGNASLTFVTLVVKIGEGP